MKKNPYSGIARTTYKGGVTLTPKIIKDMVRYQNSPEAYRRYIENTKAAFGMMNYFLKRLLT